MRNAKSEEDEKITNLRSCRVLFSLFLKKLPALQISYKLDRAEWTKRILAFFAELGKHYGFNVYLNPQYGVLNLHKEPTSEYLVDLCWSFEDEYERGYWLELALESELSSHNIESIMYDFYKLVDVKAFMKVAIFSPKLAERRNILSTLESIVGISGIKIPFEKYLVIFILHHATEAESERIEVMGYEITQSGDSELLDSKRFPA